MSVPINIAREEMANSLINMLDFTITIPLTEDTKNIHTNSFIRLNQDLVTADNLFDIYSAMGKTTASRNVNFRKNYWYVEETEVSYKNKTMKLKLLALPSVPKYDKNDMNNNSSSTNKTVNKTSTNNKSNNNSFTGNVKLRGDKYCQEIVKKAIGTANNQLTMAKKCDDYFKKNHVYTKYYNFNYGKNFKKTWNHNALNCGDGAVCLCNMFYTIGLEPKMLLSPDTKHYFVKVKIDGKWYYCDQSGSEKAHTNRRLSTSHAHSVSVWNGYSTGSEKSWK